MNKQQKIEEFLKTPMKVGDYISTQGLNSKSPESWEGATIESIEGDNLKVKKEALSVNRTVSEIKRVTSHIGVDPFKKEIRTTIYQVDIEQLLWRTGYKFTRKKNIEDEEFLIKRVETAEKDKTIFIPEVCYNPIIIDKNGEEIEFQRGLVWTLEQKQLLIESIWNNIEIGKVVLRTRKYEWVQKRINQGKIDHTAYFDLIDGKQRVSALLSYIRGEYSDLSGNYWNDLAELVKRRFMSYRNVSYIELDEQATDSETIETFLAINFTGVPMSREHIKFVQSIKF